MSNIWKAIVFICPAPDRCGLKRARCNPGRSLGST